MSSEKNVVKGIDSTWVGSVKGQGQPKERPNTAQQAPVTKPAPATPGGNANKGGTGTIKKKGN
jgi:hypothetical protein